MKIISIFLILLLVGCSTNITTQNFVYQDEQPEKSVDIETIQNQLATDNILATATVVSLVTEDGITLRGVEVINKKATVNIILFAGNGMKISQSSKVLNIFSSLPANIIWFDYRGVGVSDKKEQLSVNNIKNDGLAVFDYSKSTFPADLPTVVHGISMGTLIASYVANEKAIDGLILDGSISSVPKLVDDLTPSWSKLFYTVNVSTELAEINNIDLIKSYKKPLLLLVGEEDSITPVKNSEELFELSTSPIKVLAIIPNAEHGRTIKKDAAIKAYKSFLTKIDCCQHSES